MSGKGKVNLVLNLNTPNFFENEKSAENKVNEKKSCVLRKPKSYKFTTASKISKLNSSGKFTSGSKFSKLKSSGKFTSGSKFSKLKTISSLKAIENDNILITPNSKLSPSQSSDIISIKNKFGNDVSSEGKQKNVTFCSKVEKFSIKNKFGNKGNLIKTVNPKNSQTIHPQKLNTVHLKKLKTVHRQKLQTVSPEKLTPQNGLNEIYNGKASQNSKVTSSLFSKNEDIPTLSENACEIEISEKLFSTTTFSELDISPRLIGTLEKRGYSILTSVQHYSVPVILKGYDALVKSQTGSGKTLAYAVPVIHKLMEREPKIERWHGLYALIIVPTRELAVQTYQVLDKLRESCIHIVPGYLMGGEKKKSEKARLRKGINILVATPGRLIDHIDTTCSFNLSHIEYLVLDEADRMLDMGYESSIKSIIYSVKERNVVKQQTILLSATLTSAVEKLAGIILKSPKIIDMTLSTKEGSLMNEVLVTPQNLTQYFMFVPMKLRLVTLAAFIISKCMFSEEKKLLVFMSTQAMVDYFTSLFSCILSKIGQNNNNLTKRAKVSSFQRHLKLFDKKQDSDEDEDIDEINERDIHFMKLHGRMTQPERTAVFNSFRETTCGVFICTDVASRGLDLPQVNWIVQFNPSHDPSDYVHRVGRTARASSSGSAVVFATPSESGYISMMQKRGIRFDPMKASDVLKTLTHFSLYNPRLERIPSTMEQAATRFQDKFEEALLADTDLYAQARQAYLSFIRSYGAIPHRAREFLPFNMLHLGHVAKSFALRDNPKLLGSFKRNQDKLNKIKASRPSKKLRSFSEFDSGLD